MPTLRIDDRDYEIDDLPEETRAKVGRMQEINAQIRSLNLQINELQEVVIFIELFFEKHLSGT